jgi:SnoaL-like domain
MYKYIFLYAAVAFLVLLLFHTEDSTLTKYAMAQEEQSSNQTQIVVAQTQEEKANLERFDKLDFEAWNNRNWTLFREIHGPDVLVVDFNGNATRGIEQHVQWAMAAISAAPDSRILDHPIKIAAGNWTAVTGTLPGNVTMVTVAHWEDGRIAEEYLFMQNPTVMNQAEPGQ